MKREGGFDVRFERLGAAAVAGGGIAAVCCGVGCRAFGAGVAVNRIVRVGLGVVSTGLDTCVFGVGLDGEANVSLCCVLKRLTCGVLFCCGFLLLLRL